MVQEVQGPQRHLMQFIILTRNLLQLLLRFIYILIVQLELLRESLLIYRKIFQERFTKAEG